MEEVTGRAHPEAERRDLIDDLPERLGQRRLPRNLLEHDQHDGYAHDADRHRIDRVHGRFTECHVRCGTESGRAVEDQHRTEGEHEHSEHLLWVVSLPIPQTSVV